MKKCFLFIFIILTTYANATEYYVSTNGNNNNDGLSESKAWRTINFAVNKAKSGDIVWIKAGNYGNEKVIFKNNGKAGMPISIIGYKDKKGDINSMYFKYAKGKPLNSSEMPLLDGSNRAEGIGLKLYSRSYIVIKNIQVTNYRYCIDALAGANNLSFDNIIASNAGGTNEFKPVSGGNCLRMDTSSNHDIQIKNSIVMNATMVAITVGGNNNLIENNQTYADQDDVNGDKRSMDYHVLISGSNNIIRNHYAEHVGDLAHTGHGITLKSLAGTIAVENNIIENCDIININGSVEFRHRKVKNNIARNIRIEAINSRYSGGFHFRDGASFNIVENAYVKGVNGLNGAMSFYDSVEDGGIQWSGNDNTIRNSVFEDCDLGIRLGNNKAPSNAYNNKILNCTFYNVKTMFGFWPRSVNKNNLIQNCIISNNKTKYLKNIKESGWLELNNNYDEIGYSIPSGSGNISVDPGFIDSSKGNFRLKSSSKLIDVGKNINEVKKDYDGIQRPQGTSYDIGAFEYKNSSTGSVKANAGKDQSICLGESVTLNASGGSEYKWSTGETTSSISVSPTSTTSYTVEVTDKNSSDSDKVIVTVNDIQASAGDNQSITYGESAILTASGGESYIWSTGETTASIEVKPESTKSYFVIVKRGSCEAKASAIVTVKTAETLTVKASAGKDETICLGESVTLAASGGSEYKWSTGETTNSIIVNPDRTTTYTVTVSEDGVSDVDEVNVIINDFKLSTGIDQTISSGETVTLTASGGDSYSWSNGEITASIKVNPKQTTIYVVQATKNGCDASAEVKVTVDIPINVSPTVFADAGEDQTICLGESITLTGNGGDIYSWDNGESNRIITVKPTRTTVYELKVTAAGVLDYDKVTIIVENCDLSSNDNDESHEIQVYPNPTTGILKLHSQSLETEIDIDLININGKILYHDKINTEKQGFSRQLDLSSYTKGIYFVRFSNSNKYEVKKIVLI